MQKRIWWNCLMVETFSRRKYAVFWVLVVLCSVSTMTSKCLTLPNSKPFLQSVLRRCLRRLTSIDSPIIKAGNPMIVTYYRRISRFFVCKRWRILSPSLSLRYITVLLRKNIGKLSTSGLKLSQNFFFQCTKELLPFFLFHQNNCWLALVAISIYCCYSVTAVFECR